MKMAPLHLEQLIEDCCFENAPSSVLAAPCDPSDPRAGGQAVRIRGMGHHRNHCAGCFFLVTLRGNIICVMAAAYRILEVDLSRLFSPFLTSSATAAAFQAALEARVRAVLELDGTCR